MKIGDKISSLRKQKGLNRDELGKISWELLVQ